MRPVYPWWDGVPYIAHVVVVLIHQQHAVPGCILEIYIAKNNPTTTAIGIMQYVTSFGSHMSFVACSWFMIIFEQKAIYQSSWNILMQRWWNKLDGCHVTVVYVLQKSCFSTSVPRVSPMWKGDCLLTHSE